MPLASEGNRSEPRASDEIIWRSDARGVVLRYSTVPSPGLERLLTRTIWGDAGIKYRVLGIGSLLSGIVDPHFITLEDGQSVIGGMVCGRRSTIIDGRPCMALHIAMLAIDAAHSGRGYGPLLAKRAKPFLSDLLGGCGVIYLYVEGTHHASIELHRRLGYRDLCMLDAHIFTRISPRETSALRTIDDAERTAITHALDTAYQGHVLVDFDQSLAPERYHVLGSPGEIRCGAQISEMRWGLESLPGPAGYFTLNLLPHIPGLAGQFRPADFRFLRVSNILPPREHPEDLDQLLEACLAAHGVNAAILFMDARSPLQQAIIARMQLGLVDRLIGGKAQVLADFAGLEQSHIDWFTTHPMIASPMDAI